MKCFLSYHKLQFVFYFVVLLEDSPQDDGNETNQYSSISPPASPVAEEEPFTTYFEDKVPIPESANQVLMMTVSCFISSKINLFAPVGEIRIG